MKKSLKLITTIGTLSLLLSSCTVIVPGSSNPSSSVQPQPKTYTVTWKNFDGTELEVDEEVLEGTIPTFDSLDPVKSGDAQFSYIWDGWTPDVVPADSNAIYTATFREETKKYNVVWKNYDGEVLKTEEYLYGETPVFTDDEPTKEQTVEHTYSFDGWSPTVEEVTGNAEYTASFKEEARKYTIVWKNEDGSVLKTDEVGYGSMPEYKGDTPMKESTAQHAYIFNDWFPSVSSVSGDAEYTATYNSEIRTYTVTWQNDDGTVLEVDSNVLYGSAPSYDGEEPTKTGRGIEYTFKGWLPVDEYVTGDVTYTAQYNEKGVFSFEPINYEMEAGYQLSDINGAPWINSDVYGELEKIKRPSPKDDFYASVNYDDLKTGQKGGFDYCDDDVEEAFNYIYNGEAASITTNGGLLKAAYDSIYSGSASQVSNYLNSIDLDTYLTTKECFASENSLINLIPLEDGYEVEFNDGYYSGAYKGNYTLIGYLWTFSESATHTKSILNILSNELNLNLSSDDLNAIGDQEYDFVSKVYYAFNRYNFVTTDYTVNTIPWEPIKSALLDLGLNASTTIKIKRIYQGCFNTIYDTLYTTKSSVLKDIIVSRLAYDYRFFVGLDTYRQINRYISQMSSLFQEEAGLSYYSSDALAKEIIKLSFPELVEQTYIELESSEELKAEVAQLIDDVLDAYNQLADDSWLGSTTKAKMKRKLDYMNYVSCYSDAYKNIAKIGAGDVSNKTAYEAYRLFTNAMVKEALRNNIDSSGLFNYYPSWTVNAFYSPSDNAFVILNGLAKGLLGSSEEEKLGMLAMVVGHEITHAFDSSGSQFDEYGNVKNWWTSDDKELFSEKVDTLINFYNQISLKKGFFVDGDHVDGEATADLGGMKISLMLAKKIDRFDYDAFFRAYAFMWLRQRISIYDVQQRAQDTHPFNYLRVNVVVSQFDEFIDTYDIKPGDGMYVPEEQRIRVW